LPEDSESIAGATSPAVPAGSPVFRVEVGPRRPGDSDTHFLRRARQAEFATLTTAHLTRLFFLQGEITKSEVEQLAQTLLTDPVTETFTVRRLDRGEEEEPVAGSHLVDVTLLPGVTDPAATSLVQAAHHLGVAGLARAATGIRHELQGDLDQATLQRLATELCANPVIQRYSLDRPITAPFFPYQAADERVEVIPVRDADAETLCAISEARRLALDLAEMKAIRAYFREEGRDPTDVELEMLAQTWSEHCVHKTFKAEIVYRGPAGADPQGPVATQKIDGLLQTYIRAATEEIDKPWVRSAFVDNAGIVAFDENWDLAFKVETHNHPSALEPFGGANTGVGGVVRDILGVSARPIANTDVLCFGPGELPAEELPEGVLHPRRIAEGVVHGIEDYGNKMGIPTVNGAILFDPGYTANPLVYCGCLGILPRDSHPTAVQPGDYIVAIGGRTGRDGLRGATFSSMEMDVSTGEQAGSAVQIGNPIQEKQVQEVVLRARDEGLYHAITDCGAGGFSSAVGEMGSKIGARVQLENAPLKYPGLRPWEIWLSEAQERMVLAVPPLSWARLREICAGQDVEATVLGTFEPTGRLRLFYGERPVGDVSMAFLHDGLPRRQLEAIWEQGDRGSGIGEQVRSDGFSRPNDALLSLLAHPDIRSKEDVIRRYDHEVQGATALNPLVGVDDHGPGDAAVLVPLETTGIGDLGSGIGELISHPRNADPRLRSVQGVALGNGICPQYGALDPYAMAWAAVDEALRNVVAVGADPDRVAILDNFCWGNPNLPDRLGSLVRTAQGCYSAALAYQTPFISGKDSLNNEYTGADGQKHAIPGTLLISALGIVPDIGRTVSMDLKGVGNILYVVGETRGELGGGHFERLGMADSRLASVPPQPVPGALGHFRALHRAIKDGLVLACHDCAEGGLAVALAEMAIAGRRGVTVDNLANLPAPAGLAEPALLFSESLSRFVVEVTAEDAAAFESLLVAADVPHGRIGATAGDTAFQIYKDGGDLLLNHDVVTLEAAWRGEGGIGDRGFGIGEGPAQEAKVRAPISNLQSPVSISNSPAVLILHANGTNRDREAAVACELAGGRPEIVHVNQLLQGERRLLDYQLLLLPGGFSYGDDLGAGGLWALDVRHRLGQDVRRFVEEGRPVLGICNGFQALVRAGLLPGPAGETRDRKVTLAPNDSGHFECRWVTLAANRDSPSVFTQGMDGPIHCPVAHGEGRLVVRDPETARWLQEEQLIALTYAGQGYPANPNGSVLNIAGLTNPAGNVLGLMPHPEDHVFPWQHPGWRRGEEGGLGLALFRNGIRYAGK